MGAARAELRRIARRAGVLAILGLALGPAGALAAMRYASPSGGGDVLGCPQVTPCTLTNALVGDGSTNIPSSGDTVIMAPGTYTESGSLMPNTGQLTLEGTAGAAMPVIDFTGTGAGLDFGNALTQMSGVEIELTGSDAGAQAVLSMTVRSITTS